MQKKYEKNVWEKSYRPEYRERVQTRINRATFQFVFYHNINVKNKCFFRARAEKALSNTLTRATWYGLLSATAN